MAEGSGTINESEIVECKEVHFGESDEISENYIGQEEHSDSSQYADSCSDFCFLFCFVILFNVGHNTKVAHIYLHI